MRDVGIVILRMIKERNDIISRIRIEVRVLVINLKRNEVRIKKSRRVEKISIRLCILV